MSALDMLDRSEDEPEAGWPQTEAELAKFYHNSIMEQQQRHLEPLREDLADWLNKILGKPINAMFPLNMKCLHVLV